MHSNKYVLVFVFIMTTIVALVLSFMSIGLKDVHDENEAIFNKKAILSSIQSHLGENLKASDIPDQEVLDIFDNNMEQLVVDLKGNVIPQETVNASYKGGLAEHVDMKKEKKKDPVDKMLPVFIYKKDNGEKFYIVSVRGSGLWDDIWGCVALKDDFKTVAGAAFDHQGETPGLGAEIKDNVGFAKQFSGKSLYNAAGDYTSVVVRKGGAVDQMTEVDGISGATVTCVGVSDMLYSGIQYYQSYFEKTKS